MLGMQTCGVDLNDVRPLTQTIMVKSIKASFLFMYMGYSPLRQSSRGQHWI